MTRRRWETLAWVVAAVAFVAAIAWLVGPVTVEVPATPSQTVTPMKDWEVWGK